MSFQVLVSAALPIPPSDGEWARRFVRHGMADVLAWLGEDVGPRPDEQTHCVLGMDPARGGGSVALVSRQMYDELARLPRGRTVSWHAPSPAQTDLDSQETQ